jgi:hypothetical protein
MGRVEDLLLLEKAGELPASMQKDLDTLRAAGEVPPLEGAAEPQSDMVKRAVPAQPSLASRAVGSVVNNFMEPGGSLDTLTHGVKSGAGAMVDAATNFHQPGALGAAALGALQIMAAPVAATGRQMGGIAQDVAMALGMGPNVSAGIATATDMATQMPGAALGAVRAAPAALQGIQGAAKMLPGAQVGLREMGKKIVAAFPSALKPKVASDVLYKMVDDLNPMVQLPGFQAKAKEILGTEVALGEYGLANTQLMTAAGKAAKATARPAASIDPAVKWLGDEFGTGIAQAPRDIPFKIVQRIRQRLGERIGELRVAGGEELGSYKQLYKTLSKDLENAATEEAGTAFRYLKRANEAANREFAIGELDDIFNATMGRALEGREITSSNFAQALNKIRDLRRSDELFAKGIGAKNLDRIEGQLDQLRQLKINPPPAGVNVGSALIMGRATVAGGIGATVGTLMGGPTGGAIGAGIGSAAGAGVPWAISRIMQTPKAAERLVRLMKRDGKLSPEMLTGLATLAATQDTETQQFLERFQASMKVPELPLEDKIKDALRREQIQKMEKSAEAELK